MSFISRHTAPVDVFIRPLVHCALQQCELLAMATPVRKAFTGGAVGQMPAAEASHDCARSSAFSFYL